MKWRCLLLNDAIVYVVFFAQTLFSLGLLAMVLRNETVQAWGLLISRILRRWMRKLKLAVTRLAVGLGPIRKSELLHLQLSSPGTTWDLRSNSGQASCFALQGRRPKMEDRFTLVEKLGGTPLNLYAIYDGIIIRMLFNVLIYGPDDCASLKNRSRRRGTRAEHSLHRAH